MTRALGCSTPYVSLAAFIVATTTYAAGYDPQCMSLCTNGNYSYTYCQMQCARASSPSISPRGGLTDAMDAASQRNLQDAQTRNLDAQTKALQDQTKTPQEQKNAQQPNATQLKASIDQLTAEMKGACAREEYRPLFLHTACNANDLTLEQLTDKSLIAAADKPLYSKFRTESHSFATKLEAAMRDYGGSKGADLALARERAESLYEKNGLALYEEAISWGDYNKRRKEIADALREEFNQIAKAK